MFKYKGEAGLLLAAFIWGSGFIVVTEALQQFGQFQILAIRFLLSAAIMSVVFHKRLKKLDKATVKYGALLGLLLILGYAFQTTGLMFTTPGKNAFITASSVVFVPFIGTILYRRKIDAYNVIGAFCAFVGIGFLSFTFDASVSTGDMFTLCGAGLFAFHIFFTSEFMSRGADTGSIVAVQMATAGLIACLCALVFGQTDFSRANATGVLLLLYMAVFNTSLCYFLQAWAQKFTSETKSAVIISTECIFGALLSILFGYEGLTLRMATGALFIVGGVLITEIRPTLKKGKIL